MEASQTQHTATHYITLQHTATHCNTHCACVRWIDTSQTQYSATHCNTLQQTATTHCVCSMYGDLPDTMYCNTLQHTATQCKTHCACDRCMATSPIHCSLAGPFFLSFLLSSHTYSHQKTIEGPYSLQYQSLSLLPPPPPPTLVLPVCVLM